MKPTFARRSLKTVEWVWLVIGLLSLETIYSNWTVDRNRAYMFVLFAFLGFFMFGLRRKQRKTMEARWKSNDDASNPS
ncbi:MAG: hypothetical protein EBZ31_00350 [Flavobacteriia bacterium]|jgi:hypothetical protein|nr:hypothetical protein [Flavobacteriia bacterium]NDD46796.1 hypothetical protein [Flavobacteriia bacterium]NDD50217.1 hypothetical protein [Flavobacteriia bacterium]